jgi:two-component system, response regulator PdtaR
MPALKPARLHLRGSSPALPLLRPRALSARDDAMGAHSAERQAPRILVVEDDYLVSSEIEAELLAAGFDVVGIATTAREAVRLALAERPSLVIMDIRLEGDRDGIDAALEIFDATGIRCLFASAYHDPETRRRAEPSLPLGWLSKPYTMRALVLEVRQALANPAP